MQYGLIEVPLAEGRMTRLCSSARQDESVQHGQSKEAKGFLLFTYYRARFHLFHQELPDQWT